MDAGSKRDGWTFTVRRRHLLVGACIILVGVGGFLAGTALSSSSPPTHKSAAPSHTTTSSTRPSTSSTPVSTTTSPPSTTSTLAPTTTAPPPTPVLTAGSFSGRDPGSIGFSPACCNVVDHLTWSTWTSAQAEGSGTFEYDTCQNGCVNGPFDPYLVTITLSGPSGGEFTVLTEDVTSGPEAGVTGWTYPQQWPASASWVRLPGEARLREGSSWAPPRWQQVHLE